MGQSQGQSPYHPITRWLGRVLGEIDIDSDTPAAFGEADRRLLAQIAGIVADKL